MAPAAQEVGHAVGLLDGAVADLADGQLRIVVAERTTDEVVSEQVGVAGRWSASPRRQHGPAFTQGPMRQLERPSARLPFPALLEDPLANGPDDRLHLRVQMELLVDVADVVLDGLVGDG